MLHSIVSNKNPSDKSSQNLHHINLDKLSGALKLKAGRIKALICSKAFVINKSKRIQVKLISKKTVSLLMAWFPLHYTNITSQSRFNRHIMQFLNICLILRILRIAFLKQFLCKKNETYKIGGYITIERFDFLTNFKSQRNDPKSRSAFCYESVVISYGIVNLPHSLKLSRLFGDLVQSYK